MQITITKIVNHNTGRINFQMDHDDCFGYWVGTMPIVGHSYDVEINIPTVLHFDSEIVATQERSPSFIEKPQDDVFLIGQLEDINEDVAILRYKKSLLMLTVKGEPFPPNTWVCIGPIRLMLYDTNI